MPQPRERDDVLKAFGSAVRQRRNELGISQEELALRSGLTRSYITDVERGVRNIALRNIARLAEALDTNLAHLFRNVSEQTKTSLDAQPDQK